MAMDQKFFSLSATTPAYRGSQSMCSRPRSSGDKDKGEYQDKDNDKDKDEEKDKGDFNDKDNDKDKGKDKDKCDCNDKDKAHYQSKKPRSFSTNDSSAYKKLLLVHYPYFHHLHLAGPELKRRTLPQIPL